jgi:CRP-like cAMP-binding protein
MTSALEFCEVTVAAAADLVRDAKAVELEAGAAIWRPGDDASDLLVVFAGRLRASREGSEPVTYGPGQVAGLLEALAEGPRWYALFAETPATAMRLSSDVLLDVADEHPELASGLLAALARAAAAHFRRS